MHLLHLALSVTLSAIQTLQMFTLWVSLDLHRVIGVGVGWGVGVTYELTGPRLFWPKAWRPSHLSKLFKFSNFSSIKSLKRLSNFSLHFSILTPVSLPPIFGREVATTLQHLTPPTPTTPATPLLSHSTPCMSLPPHYPCDRQDSLSVIGRCVDQ